MGVVEGDPHLSDTLHQTVVCICTLVCARQPLKAWVLGNPAPTRRESEREGDSVREIEGRRQTERDQLVLSLDALYDHRAREADVSKQPLRVRLCVYLHACVCVCVRVCGCASVCLCVRVCLGTPLCMCVCLCVPLCACMRACLCTPLAVMPLRASAGAPKGNAVLGPKLLQLGHDTVCHTRDRPCQQTIHACLHHLQPGLDGKVDKIRVEENMVRRAQCSIVAEELGRCHLWTAHTHTVTQSVYACVCERERDNA
jgi:hypothetical protein